MKRKETATRTTGERKKYRKKERKKEKEERTTNSFLLAIVRTIIHYILIHIMKSEERGLRARRDAMRARVNIYSNTLGVAGAQWIRANLARTPFGNPWSLKLLASTKKPP